MGALSASHGAAAAAGAGRRPVHYEHYRPEPTALPRLPQVRRLAPDTRFSQGCPGHGVTFTRLVGRVLAEAIGGQARH